MGKCSYPVDIWALGCTFYELLSGEFLFDPIKDSKHSRDYFHLCLINETCGDFPIHFLKKTKHYRNFFDSKFKIIDNNIFYDNRLNKKIENLNFLETERSQINDILTKMLSIDISKRYTIDNVSSHIFLC